MNGSTFVRDSVDLGLYLPPRLGIQNGSQSPSTLPNNEMMRPESSTGPRPKPVLMPEPKEDSLIAVQPKSKVKATPAISKEKPESNNGAGLKEFYETNKKTVQIGGGIATAVLLIMALR